MSDRVINYYEFPECSPDWVKLGYEILNGFLIASQRIFNLLLDLKIKGLDRYTTDPPIQHAVVQLRDPQP